MKILNKLFAAALLVPMMAVLASCDDEGKYTPAEPETGAQVCFHSENDPEIVLEPTQDNFILTLTRQDNTLAMDVDLKVTAEKEVLDLITIPEKASFKANESTAEILCSVDIDHIDFDKEYKLSIAIADKSLTTLYGNSAMNLVVKLPARWESLGMGVFVDGFISEDRNPYEVEIQRNVIDRNKYRLVHPYDEMLEKEGYYKEGLVKEGPSEYLEFALMPQGPFDSRVFPAPWVYHNITRTGYYYSDSSGNSGEVTLYPSYIITPDVISTEDVCNYNRVVEYQSVGGEELPGLVYLAPIYYLSESEVFFKGTYTTLELISITFPGYSPKDYSLSLKYKGVLTSSDGSISAFANLTSGEDNKLLKALVVPAEYSVDEVVQAVILNDIESVEVEAGNITVPFDPEEMDGATELRLIVVSEVNGEAVNVASAKFEYYGSGDSNPWVSLGTGIYYDDFVAPSYLKGSPYIPCEVEIKENKDKPGLYRIMEPYTEKVYPVEGAPMYAPEGSFIEIDATDPNGVLLEPQYIGLNWGDGDMAIMSIAGYYLASEDASKSELKEAGYLGTCDDKKITFPVIPLQTSANDYMDAQGFLLVDDLYLGGINGKVEIILPAGMSEAEVSAATYAKNALKYVSTRSVRKAVSKKALKRSAKKSSAKFVKANFQDLRFPLN